MSTWLQRIAERLAREPKASGTQRSRIVDHFYKRSLYATSAAFLDALLDFFPESKRLTDADLRVLVEELRGIWGPEKAQEEGELAEHATFWRKLAEKSGSGYAMAFYADTLLLQGREPQAVSVFVEVLQTHPELLEELGDEIREHARLLGGAHWLEFQLAGLQVAITGRADEEDDETRELYSELLEEYSGDDEALHAIRALGKTLEAAVERGEMPRAMVIRGPSRTSN